MRRRFLVPILIAVAALAAGTGAFFAFDRGYTVSVVLPNATNLVNGGSVMRDGYQVGSIQRIEVAGGQAKVTFSVDSDAAPLHEGATVRVDWKASLGERLLTITDAPKEHAKIPDGGMIEGRMAAPVEFDQVLSALDPPTRDRLNSLVRNLRDTMDGREGDANATLHTAGPALDQIGAVLRGVGTDGEAVRQLVEQLNATMDILGKRDANVSQIVDALSDTTARTVGQRAQLGQVLQRLPGTLDRATATLRDVPGMVDQAAPLLDELAPASARLPSVAKNLRPVLTDLRPAVAQLRPALDSLSGLLRYTPALLDRGKDTAPGIRNALDQASPAMNFLRPYTPDLVGWLSNWGSASATYDANGHMARFFVQTGAEAGNVNPGIPSPGVSSRPTPGPGQAVSGTDAFGGGLR